MVVVPTSTEVTLTYGYTGIELGSYALSLLGLVGLVVMWRQGPVGLEPRRRRRGRGAPWREDGEAVDETVVAATTWPAPSANGDDQPFLLDWDEPAQEREPPPA
jgi:hypothetical protein